MNQRPNGADSSTAELMHTAEREFQVGATKFVSRVKASGPRDFVESALGDDPGALIRSGIFVVTFMPITVALISKMPRDNPVVTRRPAVTNGRIAMRPYTKTR